MSQLIRTTAPVRVADLGGWTDTWFAGSGRVCSVAVEPGAYVAAELGERPGPVRLSVGSTREVYEFQPGDRPGNHPLLEAAIAALPPRQALSIEVGADVPPGSGMGTSAAVVVALLSTLAAARGMELGPDELASMAHGVETGLGWQSGVQDQWAAAYGGINEFSVDYPLVERSAIVVEPSTLTELNQRLITVYLGNPHSSSDLHEEVITMLATTNPAPMFRRLREAAEDGARALAVGDLHRYGAAMIEHHSAIRQLHPGLIGPAADPVIAIARGCGALGWKMNGAGGNGGTLTVLGPAMPNAMTALKQSIATLTESRLIETQLSMRGVTTTVKEVPD